MSTVYANLTAQNQVFTRRVHPFMIWFPTSSPKEKLANVENNRDGKEENNGWEGKDRTDGPRPFP